MRRSIMVRSFLRTLQQTRSDFVTCGSLQHLFTQKAQEIGFQIPEDPRQPTESFDHHTIDAILDACIQLTHAKSLDQVMRHIHPGIARLITDGSGYANAAPKSARPLSARLSMKPGFGDPQSNRLHSRDVMGINVRVRSIYFLQL